MPFYDFQCKKCSEAFEVRASFKEKEAGLEPECPACHSKETRQVITAASLVRGRDGAALSLPSCGPAGGSGCCSSRAEG
jgi:putative FmdB family regulatory protein